MDMTMRVGLYYPWMEHEPFEVLLDRMSWSTPDLVGNQYKQLLFVPPDEPHDYALVLNAVDQVACKLECTWVVIFEPPEILGADHPWLDQRHPLFGANIFSFCTGSAHSVAPALHLPQATIAPDDFHPSHKINLCSMICSDKKQTFYQVKRREVRDALKATDLDIHFYGRNMPLEPDPRVKGEIYGRTKDSALRSYKFCIDFENNGWDALTDKFLDPILNATVPITNSTGAPKYFLPKSHEYIDFRYPVPDIVDRIREILADPTPYVYDIPVLHARHSLTRGKHNICEWLYRHISA